MQMIKVQFRGLESVKNFVNILSRFKNEFDIVDQRYVIDAKSIMGLFSLDLTRPLDLKIYSENEDDIKQIVSALEDYNYIVK